MPNRDWFAAGSDCHSFPPQFGNLIGIMPLLARTVIMALPKVWLNGKRIGCFPIWGGVREFCMQTVGSYLKKHTEALVKDVGIENACTITGKSRATLGRYYSDNPEHYDRYMTIDAVAALEKTASFPHVTTALAEVIGATLSRNSRELSSEEYRAGA